MSISGLSSASQAVYLKYLTVGSERDTGGISELFGTVYGAASTATTSSYLEQAAEGTVLTASGQKAAEAELKAGLYGSLFDLRV